MMVVGPMGLMKSVSEPHLAILQKRIHDMTTDKTPVNGLSE